MDTRGGSKQQWKLYLFVLVLALVTMVGQNNSTRRAASAPAGPIITGVSGTPEHGAIMSLTGLGFGSKPQAAPRIWDDMETGGFNPAWSSTGQLNINSTHNRDVHSTYNAHLDFQSGQSPPASWGAFTGGNNSPVWFMQYCFMLDANFDWGTGGYGQPGSNLANVKFARWWNTRPDALQNLYIEFFGPAHSAMWYVENLQHNQPASYFWPTYQTDITKGMWHCFRFEYKDSDPGQYNGVLRFWFDGRPELDRTDVMTRDTETDYKRPQVIGFYDAWNDSSTDHNDFYLDDVYVDNIWSRVEICASPNYGDGSHCEVQIPSDWASDGTSISFTVNAGELPSVVGQYAFVSDAAGTLSPGFRIPGTAPTGTPGPGPSPTPCSLAFSDVHPTDYFYAPAQYLYCHGIVSGYADGTFRPYNNTTRGQLSKIIVLAEGWNINTTGGPHFSDVPTSNPFYSYLETAYNHSVISGYADGTFRWGNNVTRGQLSKIVVNAEGWTIDTTGGPHFTDVPTSNSFYGYVETAYSHSIISGYADGTFKPGNNATRGQISKIVYLAIASR
jgi:hypothetical protein